MNTQKLTPRWHQRIEDITTSFEKIHFATDHETDITQDQAWCEVVENGKRRRIRFHDYHEIYNIPGLYEHLFYKQLRCCSPSRVCDLLIEVMRDQDGHTDEPGNLRVLDVGAGNGMVGDELEMRGVKTIVGVDIIPEARNAAYRDRPGIYDDYLVTDLTNLPEQQEEALRDYQHNCLTLVAALGFGDIPPRAFAKALDLIETPGWIAFNIKEDFIHDRDDSGFSRLIHELARHHVIQPQAYRRYQHRLSMKQEPLHYVAMVARKLKDVPDHLLESDS